MKNDQTKQVNKARSGDLTAVLLKIHVFGDVTHFRPFNLPGLFRNVRKEMVLVFN